MLDDVIAGLANQDQLILEAPPGAGKTTTVPLALLGAPWLQQRKIVMLQPRRIAARNAAHRMAALLGERPGDQVGYRMRLEQRVGPNTRIEVVTEGILLRMLTEDPSLEEVGLIIFDEFHERSLDGDLGLVLTLHGREMFERAQPLKLLLMSATLARDQLAEYLNASVVRSAGSVFPVDVCYRPPAATDKDKTAHIVQVIEEARTRHPQSNILVFLAGQGEIRRVQEALVLPADVSLHPLLGSLSVESQQQAIAPPPTGSRKVVLATNVAETSLTIEGVDVVIDSGVARRPTFDPNTAMSRLRTVPISQASAEQRRGRAGRLAPGTCYRLWSQEQHTTRRGHLPPEIEDADLASLALQLFSWGVYDPAELRWLTPPPAGAYRQAVDLLVRLGAIAPKQQQFIMTPHGAAMARLPTHPRLAHLLLAAAEVEATEHGARLAAVLSERDPLTTEGPDVSLRLEYLANEHHCPGRYRNWRQRTLKLARQLTQQVNTLEGSHRRRVPETMDREQLTGYLLACAYPDRIAKRRTRGGFQLANGRGGVFPKPCRLDNEPWLAVAELSGTAGRTDDVMFLAAPFAPSLFASRLAHLVIKKTTVEWNEQSGRFVAECESRCGALSIASMPLDTVSEETRIASLIAHIRAQRLGNLPWHDDAMTFLARVRQYRVLQPEFPDYSDDALLATLEDWLAPYLHSIKHLSALKKLNLRQILQQRLSWSQQNQLDDQVPERIHVPSGSSIRIDYGQNPPVLAVKLQEMFGCNETPAVAGGRLRLVVHLLSPAGRPLQVTSDLMGFWQTGYVAVRKEMRGRYPKHPWPEDPLTAPATRRTKRRQ